MNYIFMSVVDMIDNNIYGGVDMGIFEKKLTANELAGVCLSKMVKEVDAQVTHPSHYCFGKYEPRKVIHDWELNFNLGNVVKYVARAGKKDGNSMLQDLKKAKQYLEFEIEELENDKT